MLFFTVSWEAPARHASYLVLQPEPAGEPIVFLPGTRESRATGGAAVVATRREPAHPAAASTPPPPAAARPPEVPVAAAAAAVSAAELARRDSSVTRTTDTPVAQRDTSVMLPFNPDASRVAPAPQVGDGRLWVTPRPALPASVAAALYGDTAAQHSAAIERLRVMVDSLNQILDQMQRERQRPSWTVGGTPDKPAWGIDSAYIHIAGIKIPTPALALLPQGNFDEEMRMRNLNYMREDILRAADRAQSLQEFKRYVHELRDRRQAERDAEERRRAQDTVRAVP